MSAIKTTKRDQADLLQKFRSKIDALAATCATGARKAGTPPRSNRSRTTCDRLHSAAGRIDPQWASALAQVRGPLSAARQSQRLPDPAATATLVATTEQLLMRLQASRLRQPASCQRPAATDEPAARSAPKPRPRNTGGAGPAMPRLPHLPPQPFFPPRR